MKKSLIAVVVFVVLAIIGLVSGYFLGFFDQFTGKIGHNSLPGVVSETPENSSYFSGITLTDSGARDYRITGNLTGKFKQLSVTASFTGSDEKPYILSKYDSGSLKFEYKIAPNLGNLGIGKNTYTFVGLHDDMSEERKEFSFVNQRSVFRYPGCGKNDEIVGFRIWASCNVGAASPKDTGSKFVWWNSTPLSGKELITEPQKRANQPKYWTEGEKGPCKSGYHIPTVEEWNEFYYRAGQIPDSYFIQDFLNEPSVGRVEFWSSSNGRQSDDKGYVYDAYVNTQAGRGYGNSWNKIDPLPIRCILNQDAEAIGNNAVVFSDTQVKNILARIDGDIKRQQELEKNSTGVLVQGEFRAEYFPPKDYMKDTDKIVVSMSGATYEFPGVYTEKEQQVFIKCKKWKIGTTPDMEDCPVTRFIGFREFSPSGKYLIYFTGYYEWGTYIMIDSKTGKEVLNSTDMSFRTWTNDKTRFIFGTQGGMSSGPGLFITKAWEFPKTETIQDKYDVSGWYADDTYIYVRGYKNNKDNIMIYDLKTRKEVFYKEIEK